MSKCFIFFPSQLTAAELPRCCPLEDNVLKNVADLYMLQGHRSFCQTMPFHKYGWEKGKGEQEERQFL